MKLATRIFKRERGNEKEGYYVTSPFGKRVSPINGKVSYHNGTDYGTHGKKWPQYALEDGIVDNVFLDQYGAKNIWVSYPKLGYRCLHGHLDSFNVKKGQKVNHNTILGYTGETGLATGIHLHLGVKKIGDNNWIDAESIDYQEESPSTSNKFPFTGTIKKGSKLYNENGVAYKNPALKDRVVEILDEKGSKYKVYGDTFSPHIVYCNKGDIISNKYPFSAVIKKGSLLYDSSGNKYKNETKADRNVTVQGEYKGRYKIYGSTFRPNVVYCDKSAIK